MHSCRLAVSHMIKCASAEDIRCLGSSHGILHVLSLQGCPFCRKVREAICILDLDVMVYPTPQVPL